MVGHHPIYGVALMSLNAPEAVTCFWCLVQVVFAGSMGSPASPPGIYAHGLRRFYASQAKPVEQPYNRWGALATPAQPQRRTGCPTFWLMHSLIPCPELELLPSALLCCSLFKVHAVPVANRWPLLLLFYLLSTFIIIAAVSEKINCFLHFFLLVLVLKNVYTFYLFHHLAE